MRYHHILEAASKEAFVLAAGLSPKNYQITPSLGDVGTWKAKILVANSAMEGQNVGDWDNVGYVLIGLKSNEIIPVARADEHNTGYDLLHTLMKSKRNPLRVNPRDYFALYNGPNFIYGKGDVPLFVDAISKWLAYGGPNETIRGAMGVSLFGTFKDFIRHKHDMLATSEKIPPLGEQIIKLFSALQQINDRRVLHARDNRDVSALDKSFYRNAMMLGKIVAPVMHYLWVRNPEPEQIVPTIKQFIDQDAYEQLEAFIFSHNGIKNELHMKIRKAIRGEEMRDVQSVFGNLELADQMLGRGGLE